MWREKLLHKDGLECLYWISEDVRPGVQELQGAKGSLRIEYLPIDLFSDVPVFAFSSVFVVCARPSDKSGLNVLKHSFWKVMKKAPDEVVAVVPRMCLDADLWGLVSEFTPFMMSVDAAREELRRRAARIHLAAGLAGAGLPAMAC